MGLHSIGRLFALATNIRLRWKRMTVAQTLAYYNTSAMNAVKCFVVQAPGTVDGSWPKG
jgi:hypothetical protein